MACGVVKIYPNHIVWDDYTRSVGDNWSRDELTRLKEKAVAIYAKFIWRAMNMPRSSGKAARARSVLYLENVCCTWMFRWSLEIALHGVCSTAKSQHLLLSTTVAQYKSISL